MIDRVQGLGAQAAPGGAQAPQAQKAAQKGSFGQMLQQMQQSQAQQAASTGPQQAINFSKHAISRAEERGIELTPALMEQLAGSVEKAQEKGAKNILAFNANQAFIINVPYGRVITTMSQDEMKENIFTNIDGAVLL